jgi:hypothetical protein
MQNSYENGLSLEFRPYPAPPEGGTPNPIFIGGGALNGRMNNSHEECLKFPRRIVWHKMLVICWAESTVATRRGYIVRTRAPALKGRPKVR